MYLIIWYLGFKVTKVPQTGGTLRPKHSRFRYMNPQQIKGKNPDIALATPETYHPYNLSMVIGLQAPLGFLCRVPMVDKVKIGSS